MSRLTDDERLVLGMSFTGPRPGSNDWPFVALERDGREIDGEIVDGLIRRGLLTATARPAEISIPNGQDHITDHPIDCTHDYDASPAGRSALATPAGGEEGQ